jgi:NADPH:quinone reductase-like Zn-dependent oxidoreductase
MSRAVRYHQFGPVEVLKIEDVPDPVAGDGEVRVRVKAAGINPGEAKIRDGVLAEQYPSTFPSGQGSDLAGVIDQVGPGVNTVTIDDEVIGFTDDRASQAELVVIPAVNVTPRPPEVPWEVAGSLFVAGATAWAAVRAVNLQPGETVVVSAAAGGVGSLVIQLAKRTGAAVIGLAGETNHDWLRAHGVVPVTHGDGVADRIRASAPDGVDAFIDLYGAPYVDLALDLGVKPDRIDTIADFQAVATHGVKAEGNAAGASAAVLAELAEQIASGDLEFPIDSTFPLDQVQDAYRELARGHTHGKIVLITS